MADLDGESPVVYVVSDSIGETAEAVARAAASQFNSGHVSVRRVSYVEDEEKVVEVLDRAADQRAAVVHTLIFPELRNFLNEQAAERSVPTVDIMGPTMAAMSEVLQIEPHMEPGILHQLDDAYFRRVDAVEFAVKYDDGKDPRGLLRADIVLIGVSRTSKTPVSMYLAHKEYKVANVPLVPEVEPPEELYRVPRERVVGLAIGAATLADIRRARLRTLGLGPEAEYGDLERIREEIRYARSVFDDIGCQVVDVSAKAVEETANDVLHLIEEKTGIESDAREGSRDDA